jgi:hypothetical protein
MVDNLFQDEDEASTPERPALPKPKRVARIVCVAGRNELDEAAELLLVNLLRLAAAVQGRLLGLPVPDQHQLTRASRYLIRRIRRRAPLAQVLVGFGDPPRASWPSKRRRGQSRPRPSQFLCPMPSRPSTPY